MLIPKIHAGNPWVTRSDELCEGHDRGVTMTTPTSPPFTVVYEVTGGEDGPQINNFEVINGESISFPKEEHISTASFGAVLKAKVTGISEN